jgi:hypothetical protein
VGAKAVSASHGGGRAGTARPLTRPAEGAEGRILDSGLVVVGQGQFNQAVKVLEYLRVALYRRSPVFIDAPLESCLCDGELIRVRWLLGKVVCAVMDEVEVLGVRCLATLSQEAEVLEDVVLCVSSDP